VNCKIFSATRICAIDFLPHFNEALKQTKELCKVLGLKSTNQRVLKDIEKLFYHYSSVNFYKGYKECKSDYSKILVVYFTKQTKQYEKVLQTVLKNLTIPWCICSSFNSPDIELTCLQKIDKFKYEPKKAITFVTKNRLVKLHNVLKKDSFLKQTPLI
jgi:hypothetical protein